MKKFLDFAVSNSNRTFQMCVDSRQVSLLILPMAK